MTVATLHSSPAKKGLRVYQGSAWKSGAYLENAAQNTLVQINNFVSQDGSGFRYGTNQRSITANIREFFVY